MLRQGKLVAVLWLSSMFAASGAFAYDPWGPNPFGDENPFHPSEESTPEATPVSTQDMMDGIKKSGQALWKRWTDATDLSQLGAPKVRATCMAMDLASGEMKATRASGAVIYGLPVADKKGFAEQLTSIAQEDEQLTLVTNSGYYVSVAFKDEKKASEALKSLCSSETQALDVSKCQAVEFNTPIYSTRQCSGVYYSDQALASASACMKKRAAEVGANDGEWTVRSVVYSCGSFSPAAPLVRFDVKDFDLVAFTVKQKQETKRALEACESDSRFVRIQKESCPEVPGIIYP